jgi:hypothetical protein
MTTASATAQSNDPAPLEKQARPGWDVLLLALLVFALLQITGLAEASALPTRVQDVLRHPLLGHLLPQAGMAAFGDVGPRPGDPIGLLLAALAVGSVILYAIVDLALHGRWCIRIKWLLLTTILLACVFLPTTKLILLRQQSGPASYSHDGGVIQTEATIRYLFEGKNPYTEDYTQTPMAEWGFSQYRTALYHYPYLPWTFLFSAPFFLLAQSVGHYDQRVVYMILLALALLLAPRMVNGHRRQLALVALLGLNPIMALDVIFGQNDLFVLSWLIFSLVLWRIWQDRIMRAEPASWALLGSTICFGLACASKPTAWFLAPFYGLLLVSDHADLAQGWRGLWNVLPDILRRAWPALAVFAVIVTPYLLWDGWSLYDDVWRWSSGQGETGYQIWGWGASNFVLAAGWVSDRFDQWPFWLLEIVVALPVLIWLVRRQQQANSLANATWHYGLFLLIFFYVSRFLNENYLGYILAFLAMGILCRSPEEETRET